MKRSSFMVPGFLALGVAAVLMGTGPSSAPDKTEASVPAAETAQGAPAPSDGARNAPAPAKAGAYIPGGFALCPCMDGPAFIVSDNSNGRILQVNEKSGQQFRTVLISGLEKVGDVDIAENGRAFVYAAGSVVVEHYFGLTAFVHDGKGSPLAGAEIVVDGPVRSEVARTDGEGRFTVFDLVPPPPQEPPIVTVTVTSGIETRQFPVQLEKCCQTFKELVFAPEAEKRGTLIMQIYPEALALAGVKWRLSGIELWLDSTQTLQIVPGEYTVVFGDATGYKTPEPVTVLVSSDHIKTVEAQYQPQ